LVNLILDCNTMCNVYNRCIFIKQCVCYECTKFVDNDKAITIEKIDEV